VNQIRLQLGLSPASSSGASPLSSASNKPDPAQDRAGSAQFVSCLFSFSENLQKMFNLTKIISFNW
jgi:hypothetical protein